jgi:spermidine synthase
MAGWAVHAGPPWSDARTAFAGPPWSDTRAARAISLSVACLGFSAVVTQMVTAREFLNLFSGNELILGLILGNWLLLTGLGGVLGRYAGRARHRMRWLLWAQVGIGLLPAVQIAGVRMAKGLLTPGVMVGIGEAFWLSFAVLLPFCVLSGFLLVAFSGLASARRDWRQIGDVYVLDTLGGIAGGLLFSVVLVRFVAPFQIATLLLALNLLAAAVLAQARGRRAIGASLLLVLVVAAALLVRTDLERVTGRAMFPGLDVVSQRATPYGNLAVTRQGKQITVYENGIPIGATEDLTTAEEVVHYALAQHPDPRAVLLVSGGVAGAHREVEKYPVERIDYVELDPAVLDLAIEIADAGSDPRLHLIAADARQYIRSRRGAYDAILMALPDPSSAQLNRFYTEEFFAEVRRALRPSGVFSFGLTGAENYATAEVRVLTSAIHRALSASFPNILVIPGARQYFVASERPLGYDIAARLERRHIDTRYVRGEYLAAKLTDDRLAAARNTVAAEAAPNRDFRPGSYYVHLRYWLSQFGSGMFLPALLVAALLVLIGGLVAGSADRAVPAALCASGFAGMGLEVVLLIAFQVTYGYVYQQLGLIVTGFMIGAALGAAWSGRGRADASALLLRLDAALAAVAFVLIPIVLSLHATDSALVHAAAPPLLFPLLNGIVGFLVGAQFPPGARLLFHGVEETAGTLYAVDLLGACLGALAVGTFSVPLLGITGTCGLLGAIKVASAAALRVRHDVPAAAALRMQGDTAVAVPSPRPVPSGPALRAFGVVLFVLVAIGMGIVVEHTSGEIYAFSFAPAYAWALVLLLAAGIVQAMRSTSLPARVRNMGVTSVPARARSAGRVVGRFVHGVHDATRVRISRWVYFFAFSLAVFYPVFRCYFRVPYLFCHVCPRTCIFGFMRPYLVPAALIMNLEKRYWCYHACPIGTLYDCQARVCTGSRRVPAWLRAVAVAVLVFTAVAYFKLEWDLGHQPNVALDWYMFFYNNVFAVSAAVIAISAVLIVMAWRLRRSFCETLCPVGAFADLVLRLERGR